MLVCLYAPVIIIQTALAVLMIALHLATLAVLFLFCFFQETDSVTFSALMTFFVLQ